MAFTNILFATLYLGLKLVSKLQIIFQHIFQPITQSLLIRLG